MHAMLMINFTSFHNSQKQAAVSERLKWEGDTSYTPMVWQIEALIGFLVCPVKPKR